MIESIRRWLAKDRHAPAIWARQAEWARLQQWPLRSAGDAQGFVVDGQCGTTPWRLEWGPSQRVYIAGTELRLRADVGAPRELQALVLTRPLMEAMECSVFDQFVEGVQTRIDTRVPPEMRWLVMHPKLPTSALGSLAGTYGALASGTTWLRQWLAGPLVRALGDAPTGAERPLVLMIARGRLTLRTAEPDADVARLKAWQSLFECALREAQRVVADHVEPDAPSTQPSLFHPAAMPAQALSPSEG